MVIAFWDGDTWVELTNIVVDPVTGTISGETSHFTDFAVIARTAPAEITGSDLSITPREIDPGDSVRINFTATNSGDLTGKQTIILRINGVESNRQSVTLLGGESQDLSFDYTCQACGTHEVSVLSLEGSFIVKDAVVATTEPPITQAPSTPEPVPTTPVEEIASDTEPVVIDDSNTGWIYYLVAGIIVVLAGGWFVVRRRRTSG